MAAGVHDISIVENPTELTVSAAIGAMITATDATARFTVTPLGMGKGVLIVGVSQA